MSIDREWLSVTLTDALQALSETLDRLEDPRLSAQSILEDDLANVYAKLNYAVNTAELGPDAINTCEHDALIQWPEIMPFDRFDDEPIPAEQNEESM